MTLSKIENWHIVDLSTRVIRGELHNKTLRGIPFYTDTILYMFKNYVVTETTIYKLGLPDKVWINTSEAKQKLSVYES